MPPRAGFIGVDLVTDPLSWKYMHDIMNTKRKNYNALMLNIAEVTWILQATVNSLGIMIHAIIIMKPVACSENMS